MKTLTVSLCLALIVVSGYSQGIRKSGSEMTTAEQDAYRDILIGLQDIIEELADYHYDNFNVLHGCCATSNWQFLPFHRVFLWEMENAIQRENPALSIPYWNWLRDDTTYTSNLLQNFLPVGAFPWPLQRTLDTTTGWGPLPTASEINIIQAHNDFWTDYVQTLEGIHLNAHNWINGDMKSDRSPIDPIFYLHHAMIDKLWQLREQSNLGEAASDYFIYGLPSAMSRYDGSIDSNTIGTSLPSVDPRSILDARGKGVFYSDDELGITKLNGGYFISNEYQSTENFIYPFIIEVSEFMVPAGKTAYINSNTQIALKSGFVSQGTLVLKVGGYDDNFTSPLPKRPAREEKKPIAALPTEGILTVSRSKFNLDVTFHVNEDVKVVMEAFDAMGRMINIPQSAKSVGVGKHTLQLPLHNGHRGALYLRLKVGNKYHRRIVPAL